LVAGLVSAAGAAVLALGINKIPVPTDQEFARSAASLDEKRVLILYSCSTLFLGGLQFVVGSNSGFAQILMTLSSLKWIFFMIYGFICWTTKKNWWIFAIMVLFEFTTALYSFFSNFKEVILITIAMSITLVRKVSLKQVLTGMADQNIMPVEHLPRCVIRGSCRWYSQRGADACRACVFVVTDHSAVATADV